ncbi:uncharacterized protein [Fopius arisanus]|uniref:Uncharacterized protein isoform X2 n=1 Tax=Fopius arisanus TaxID=64838 RepID=A0A9R1STG5_9HYME|nr:PREDICTED: uncharacterized protein LOC105262768 isoform X2 [Fopius arisanus]
MGKLNYSLLFLFVNCLGLEERYDAEQPYCFKFTWLGSKSEEINISSNRCANATGQPCFQPVVVTNDSTLPDVNYMWRTGNRSEISCRMRQGYVCIKYAYTYNNAVLNISHFCGKMVENKASPIVEGCYTQQVDSHIIEACACTSAPGGIPCNSAEINQLPVSIIMSSIILSWIIY